jgi:LysR family transcriptional regulator, glycine cleavage system transcriptional activator
MIPPYRSLPSLQTLRCFEAAARLGSFTMAAEEMCITHSAVSHQIRQLEESIGQSLFQRQGNRMALTGVGRALAVETRRALDYLREAYAVASVAAISEMDTLNLAVQFGIAEHWLMPRLEILRTCAGEVGLRITTLPDLAEDCPDEVDVALVYGTGEIPGMQTERIADETVFPVCSPAFLSRHPDLTLESMADAPLLLHSRVTWNLWLEKANLPIAYPRHPVLFDDVALTIRGALSGHGIAMARSLLVRDYLERGDLIRLFDLSVSGVFGYYLGWRSDAARQRFASVRDWIIAGMAAA